MKWQSIPYIIVFESIFLVTGCKTPQVSNMTDHVKDQIPSKFREDSVAESRATVTPWRQFFTDPTLVSLIDTALINNQDLRMTLQQIAIAKSNVLYQEGQLQPSVSGGGSVSVSKAGRYTSEGAGNATTDIKPGKSMPDPLMDYQIGATDRKSVV